MINRSHLLAVVVALIFMSGVSRADTQAIAPEKIQEEYSTSKRIGCIAQLEGYQFNLKELQMPIDE